MGHFFNHVKISILSNSVFTFFCNETGMRLGGSVTGSADGYVLFIITSFFDCVGSGEVLAQLWSFVLFFWGHNEYKMFFSYLLFIPCGIVFLISSLSETAFSISTLSESGLLISSKHTVLSL